MEGTKNMKNNENITVIDALQSEMKKNGYISETAMREIAKNLNMPISEVYGVATFYHQFKFKPNAKYLIEICTGTACFILGASVLLDGLKKRFNVEEFENTADNKFCIATVRCLGCCGEAPVVRINGKIYGKMTLKKLNEILDGLE